MHLRLFKKRIRQSLNWKKLPSNLKPRYILEEMESYAEKAKKRKSRGEHTRTSSRPHKD